MIYYSTKLITFTCLITHILSLNTDNNQDFQQNILNYEEHENNNNTLSSSDLIIVNASISDLLGYKFDPKIDFSSNWSGLNDTEVEEIKKAANYLSNDNDNDNKDLLNHRVFMAYILSFIVV
ncbi:uncharacterized protein KGF55_004214 [Candida pseudojiufengensis]|uniref:uncharacterized protein n=1 Tax=Candida pseudojiufengensis TaxID=497109 RepID=UPI00222479B6|nr:uncharacterized protein KGF55_004214 [Candida pseudojiufengensis]KAI5960947.1 hypothetical protein KGF55_004214 [Candida pseudojiufengensis]